MSGKREGSRKARRTQDEAVRKAKSPERDREAVRSTLDDYVRAFENRDIRLYSQVVANDSGMVNFGTDASERVVGWEALKRHVEAEFAQLSEPKATVSEVTVNVAAGGRFAWATSLWNFRAKMGEQTLALPVRCSWVLEKRGARWVIVHFHKSVGTTG
jgi:uncharacterized protein (TIGR02246 family)